MRAVWSSKMPLAGTPAILSLLDGPVGVEELSEDGALSQAMSDDDPDRAPKEWAQTGGATAVAQEPPPAPVFPKHSPPRSNAVMRSVLRS